MDGRAAKQYPIVSLLAALQIPVVSVSARQEHYCLSPFRAERTPSFVANARKNVWIDFGELGPDGKPLGGDNLALLMRYFRVALPQARALLAALVGLSPAPAPTRAPRRAAAATSEAFQDVVLAPLSYAPLLQYLQARGINWALVRRNAQVLERLQQVFYRTPGTARERPYFALAWRSDAGGWELRSKRFQACLGTKGLSLLPGTEPSFAVFEGFFDYLAALTHYRCVAFRCHVLILNSVSLAAQALPLLAEAPVVRCFLDNDAAGRKTLRYFEQHLPPGCVRDESGLYAAYKDVNDFVLRQPPTKPLPLRQEPAHSPRRDTARWWLWVVFAATAQRPTRQCTFYCYTNDAAGYAALERLLERLRPQLAYARLCERTQGQQFRVLHAHTGLRPAAPAANQRHPHPPLLALAWAAGRR